MACIVGKCFCHIALCHLSTCKTSFLVLVELTYHRFTSFHSKLVEQTFEVLLLTTGQCPNSSVPLAQKTLNNVINL